MKAAAKQGKDPESIQAAKSDDGFSVPELLLICEQHNAKIEAAKVRYQNRVPPKKLSELHQEAEEMAAGLKTEALEGHWPSYKVELEAVKRLANYERQLVEGSLPEPLPIANYGGEQFPQIMQAAFCRNAGLGNLEKVFQPEILEASDKYEGVGLAEMLLQCAHRNGYSGRMSLTSGNLREVMEAAFSTSTVTTMLTQAGDKFLLDGFERVAQRWREVSSTRSVSNFRQHTGFRLTASMEYEEVPASGELQHGDVAQESWNIQAKTYGRLFTITRANIINDDLGAFDALRTRIGMGAGIKMASVFWTAWLAAVNGAAYWTSARANYQTGATTALGDAALSAAVTLFRQMPAPDGNLLDLEPDRLLVPPELEAVARKLYVSQEMRDTTANTRLPVANVHQNRFRPIVVPQLSNSTYTGYSTTHWFLCADPRLLASAEMAFLNGREQPTVESSDADFNTLGIQLRAYHDFGVAMTEYRASVLSAGA
jgi:phage major head subunit gpT-like protein